MKIKHRFLLCMFNFERLALIILTLTFLASCNNYFKNDYTDNSPTSGKLKIYYDEGLQLHVKNQALTFEAQYPNAQLETICCSESDAVQALYSDSCEAIVISRLLNETEKNAFATKNYFPKYSVVAKSGIALITNCNTPLKQLSYEQVLELITNPLVCFDSLSNETKLQVVFDKKNSSVLHYLADTILKGKSFSSSCFIANSTIESINMVANQKNIIALVDFAWLSDVDDSISKSNKNKIKFIPISQPHQNKFAYPDQSNFKTGAYPFTRNVYIYRKTGDFSLAKGFETFVAGPKGQTTFLKQGLLPTKQQERSVEIKMEPLSNN